MKFDKDDPRLIDYALGELDDAERDAVEAALAEDEDARKIVKEIRVTAQAASEAMKAEPAPALTDEQRSNILETAAPGVVDIAKKPRKPLLSMSFLTKAAGVLVVLGVGTAVVVPNLMRSRMTVNTMAGKPVDFSKGVATDAWNSSQLLQPGSAPPPSRGSKLKKMPAQPSTGYRAHTLGREGERESEVRFIDSLEPLADLGTESYDRITDNAFVSVLDAPLSTFSIDVDTASYSNMRRFIMQQGHFPPKDAVRIEEMVNYFNYDYELPLGDDPFSANVDIATCPWNGENRLARIGLKGWEIAADERPACNLTFLLDVSGSMNNRNKLPLVKEGMKLLVNNLNSDDRVAIAVYAGAAGLVLPSTSAGDTHTILGAMDKLNAGGSTAGGAGIQLAYDTATQNFVEGGINRVILATDGDFNVGITDQGSLTRLIEDKAKSGVFLTVLGFGMGNYKDSTLEKLADKGNGNYAYIDNINEARKVLVEEIGSTLVTIAKDVKIQVEFNPTEVSAYRLIGYENRLMAARDFNDDSKDAGEIGAGHTVTALYEIVPAGMETHGPKVDPLKYQARSALSPAATSGEVFTLKLRYKEPDGDTSKLLEFPIRDNMFNLPDVSKDFRFAAAVAGFGMILRDSPYKGSVNYDMLRELAEDGLANDDYGYRREFMEIVSKAENLRR
ncbi:von Willebrand factor type A domain-containing protein [Candidatus Hydrogenedentota bacterium]